LLLVSAAICLSLTALLAPRALSADRTWDGGASGNGTAWTTAANWIGDSGIPGSTGSTTNTDIATIVASGTNPAIGISGTTFFVGAVDFASTANRAIGASGITASTLNLQLNGNTVGVANTILRNQSTGTLTFQANNGQATPNTLQLALGNATDNIVTIDGTGGITVDVVITGASRHLTLGGTGAGALTLKAGNTYSGGTTIDSGTLLANNTTGSATGTGAVIVNSGGTLGGTGSTGAVTVNAGGTLAPGASIGTLKTGNISLVSGLTNAVMAIDLNVSPAADLLDVTGTVNLGSSTLLLSLTGSLVSPLTFLIVNNDLADAVSGTFASITGLPSGYTASVDYAYAGTDALGRTGSGNDVAVTLARSSTAVPEASAFLFGVVVCGLFGASALRRPARRTIDNDTM
jgi:autotransporter-associated beta strand protein